ncbi:hypothetical protein QJS10_CPB11g01412 [Acorus calamus]|uniref:WD repeat-containing protein 75 second beta-propeller domain-containing protein n=1 Tax=Acorus calamus TaxID=4465 RepID=A0AAV9DUW3_ACOCL|nr:hypothetical protein QJS10_CPB11g01412 [Acorus calamus]
MITGGKSLVSSPPAFSNDGKKLLICSGNTVSIISTATGLQVTELEGHTDRVTCVIVEPVADNVSKFMNFCWTSSLDRTICYWDFAVPELIKKLEVKNPVHSMVIPSLLQRPLENDDNKKPSNLYAFISIEDKNKPSGDSKALRGQIQMYDLRRSRKVGGLLAETRYPETIVVNKSGEYFAIRKKRQLLVWKVPSEDSKYDIKKIKLNHTKKLSAFAFHPSESIVAGGDVTGRILIWRGVGERKLSKSKRQINKGNFHTEEERPGVRGNDNADSCSTWHWHSTEVKFLSFSADGINLYSGGNEGVLVVWQLDSGERRFLPRIGSPLLYFVDSPDPCLSCVSCADNQIHLLKMPLMDITRSISGIKLPCLFPDIYEGLYRGFAFNRAAGLAALQTQSYCIQFFSLYDDREVSQVQVLERNYQPGDEITVVVTLVALSSDGSTMSTVEVKLPEEQIGGLVTLKFWASGSHNEEYSLSTVIYEPHSDAGISALAFHPSCSMAVSSSYGGDFKIWVQSSPSSIDQQKDQTLQNGWKCQSVGSYKGKPMTAAAFSADGSVLAVAAETVVTLWDPDTNILVAVIGETVNPIVHLSFIGKSEYLASVSRGSLPQLSVWNLSKLSISWSYKLYVEAVTCSVDNSHFAVLSLITKSNLEATPQDQDGVILVFKAEDQIPVASWFVKKASGGGLSFLSKDPSLHDGETMEENVSSLMLVYINCDHEYVIFDPYGNEDHQTSKIRRENPVHSEGPEPFGYASIYGELPEITAREIQVTQPSYVPSERPWETIFSGPSHVLPPLMKLCSAFLASLLETRPTMQDSVPSA